MGNNLVAPRPVDRNVLEELSDGFYKDCLVTVYIRKDYYLDRDFRFFFTGYIINGNIVGYAKLKDFITEENRYTNEIVLFFENGVAKGHCFETNRIHKDRVAYGYILEDSITSHYRMNNERAISTTKKHKREHIGSYIQQGTLRAIKKTKDFFNGKTTQTFITPAIPFEAYDVFDSADWEFLKDERIIGKTIRDSRDPSAKLY